MPSAEESFDGMPVAVAYLHHPLTMNVAETDDTLPV
jgi:hypothetical protein